MRFTTYRLGDICRMKYGKMPPKDTVLDSGFPIFTGYRITGYAREYLWHEPRVVVVARGVGGTGDVKLSPEQSWITNLAIVLEHDEDIVDRHFLFYRLGQEPLKDKLNTGAAQAQITIDSLKQYPLALPDLHAQQHIASTLSVYDDLIENNRRRIQLLEESARLLYREWFVHLRFPGHEHVKVVEGVPEGWERRSLGDVTTLHYGKALKQEDRVEGVAPVYGSSGEVGSHEIPLVSAPGIIVGRKGNVGSVYWTDSDFWPIDTVYYVEPSNVSWFLYQVLSHMAFVSSDAAVPGLNRQFAYSRRLVWPSARLRGEFEQYARDLSAQISVLTRQNYKLAQARDLLLPRLMNGDIAV